MVVLPSLYIRYRHATELRRGEKEKEIHQVLFLASRDCILLDVGVNKDVYTYAMLAYSVALHANATRRLD